MLASTIAGRRRGRRGSRREWQNGRGGRVEGRVTLEEKL